MTTGEHMVLVEAPMEAKKFLGIRRARLRAPKVRPEMHLYVSTRQVDGSRELHRVMEDGQEIPSATDGRVLFYHVSLNEHPFSSTLSAVLTDKQGHGWDCRIAGQMSVTDSRKFLTSFAANAACPNAPLPPESAASWIAGQIKPRVRDSVASHSVEDLRDSQVLPPSRWEKQLSDWLGEFGVAVRVDEVSWSSAQAEAAQAEAARQRDLERVAQARQREREAELSETTAKAEYETRKKQIESDLSLSEQERAHQLQLLEKRHRKELIEADTQIENAQREAEKAVLEHEATLARLRQDAEAVKHAEERDREAEDCHETVMRELDDLRAALATLVELPDNLLAQLADQDAGIANAAAERVVSPEFGVSASSLAELGFRVERQNLVQSLREKAAADGEPVVVRKTELITRDVGTAKVKGLPINASLQFEFSTSKAGYLTLLNIGTSGMVYVHVPNAYVSPDRAIVDAGRSYAVPGPEMLPWDRMRQFGLDYVEIGPPGWEHIVVLVSEEPLISARTVATATSDCPFVKLTGDDIAELCDTLSEESVDRWSAGVLSFLVA